MLNDKHLDLWKELVEYDESTGSFYWKERQSHHYPLNEKRKENWNCKYAGQIAGNSNCHGYVRLGYNDNKITCAAHRLAWAFIHGEWPKGEIDHINRIRDDNRIENLRDTTQHINYRNVNKKNLLGERNISINNCGNYVVRVRNENGKRICMGTYKTLDKAIESRDIAERNNGYL